VIQSIRIENFQAHKSLRVKLDPSITTIVGPSDTGKSAVVRALSWVAFNSPSGASFIRDGSDSCTVGVIVDNKIIKRKRGKTANYYELIVDKGKKKRLESLRGDVPDDVKSALKLEKINFQYQHDSPMWLSESAGQVAKNLNEIVDLDLIDRVLTSINKSTRTVAAEMSVCEGRLLEAGQRVKSLEWINDAIKDYSKIESTQKQIDEVRTKHTQLQALVDSVSSARDKVRKLSQIVEPFRAHLESIGNVKTEIEETNNRIVLTASILDQIKSETDRSHKLLVRINDIQTELSKVKECPLCRSPIK
jgi:DNA repair protein SbcC/Rad50